MQARLELAELTTARQEALEQKGFAATQRFDEARLQVAELRALSDTELAERGLSRDEILFYVFSVRD